MVTRDPAGRPASPKHLGQRPERADARGPVRPADRLDRLRSSYDRIQPRLWRAILGWSGSREVADEATAEAFAQAARRLDHIRDVDAWVWRAGFRIAAGELHRRTRRPRPVGSGAETALLAEQQPGGRATPDDDLQATALDLMAALKQLTPQQRACVVLRDLGGLSVAQTAAALGASQATVRVQALRGRRRLRDLLEASHG